MPVSKSLRARAAEIRMAVFDVDGVLTDGRLYLGNDGSELRAFHARDGMGLVMLLAAGLEAGIISGLASPAMEQRMKHLGVRHVLHGRPDKRRAWEELLQRTGLPPSQACFTGDDVLDLPAMETAGLAVAVADAHPRVRRAAHWITQERGGRGAAREVCDLLLEVQGKLEGVLEQLDQDPARTRQPTSASS